MENNPCNIVIRIFNAADAMPLTGYNNWIEPKEIKRWFCKTHGLYFDTLPDANAHERAHDLVAA